MPDTGMVVEVRQVHTGKRESVSIHFLVTPRDADNTWSPHRLKPGAWNTTLLPHVDGGYPPLWLPEYALLGSWNQSGTWAWYPLSSPLSLRQIQKSPGLFHAGHPYPSSVKSVISLDLCR